MVYKRYASLYFVMGIDVTDNELITLEVIHHYVEVLDRYFGNVCELDLIFNFHKARGNSPASAYHLQEPCSPLFSCDYAWFSVWTHALTKKPWTRHLAKVLTPTERPHTITA